MFTEVLFCDSAEVGIIYGSDLLSRNSAEFFPAQYRGIPWYTAEFCIDLYTEFPIPIPYSPICTPLLSHVDCMTVSYLAC